jgi:uncharacterized protein (TIGR03067 family)
VQTHAESNLRSLKWPVRPKTGPRGCYYQSGGDRDNLVNSGNPESNNPDQEVTECPTNHTFTPERVRMKTAILALFASSFLLGTDPTDDAKSDQKKLQGKWTVTSAVLDGNEIPKDQFKGTLVHTDNKYSWTSGEGQGGSGTFKLNPSKKPKAMDCVPSDGPLKGQTVEEIYEIDGDNLKICLALPGTQRPTEFKSDPGSGLWLFTYKRAK